MPGEVGLKTAADLAIDRPSIDSFFLRWGWVVLALRAYEREATIQRKLMAQARFAKAMMRIAAIVLVVYAVLVAVVYYNQRALLFFPTHHRSSSALQPWLADHRTIGFCREVPNPRAVWLMMHGNAGQAADRDYVLPRMADDDSLYVLEYPGYGDREGSPSLDSINQAAAEAYQWLRLKNPARPICVLGESIGSGPACALAREAVPPDKIMLVVPFDTLASVASERFFFLPVRYMLRDPWNNVEALSRYKGPVDIFGASEDEVIPVKHAKALARKIPTARFTEIGGGHNDWSDQAEVTIR